MHEDDAGVFMMPQKTPALFRMHSALYQVMKTVLQRELHDVVVYPGISVVVIMKYRFFSDITKLCWLGTSLKTGQLAVPNTF